MRFPVNIRIYEESGLAGSLIGGTPAYGLIIFALTLAGIAMVVRGVSVASEYRLLLCTWMGGAALIIAITSPVPWARYYLPLAPAATLLVAYALTEIAGALARHISQRRDGVAVLA